MVCVLEDMVTSFPYASTVFVKTLLFPDVISYFVTVNFSVGAYDSFFGVFFLFAFFHHLRLSFVVLLIKRYHR